MSSTATQIRAESWIELGPVDSIPRLGARVVHTPGADIAVFRTAGDEIYALRDQCPHKGGPLSQGIVHGREVTCPLHNWKIQLASGDAVTPDEGCAAVYPVRVEDGCIYLCIDAGG